MSKYCLVAIISLLVSPLMLAANFEVVANSNLTFSPSSLTIDQGDTVTFRNAGGFHNVVASGASSFRCANGCADTGATGNLSSSAWTFTRTLNNVGIIEYFCEAHGGIGSGMSGRITVRAVTPVNIPITAKFTGAWFDPAQSGHGLFIEVLPNNQMFAYWFAFAPDGTQSWFGGLGTINGNTVTMNVTQTTGGRWIPNFNPMNTTNTPWGTFTITFTDCNNGRVEFVSNIAGYGTGSMRLSRITQPAGLSCSS
jgi:plastocyanin